MICSDHTPVDDQNLYLPFAEAEPGASAVELLLPLTVKWAHEAGLAPAQALACVTSKAAAIVGCPGGQLAVGAPADITLFDPAHQWTVSAETLRSQCAVTPWSGLPLTGRGRVAVMGGRLIEELPLGSAATRA